MTLFHNTENRFATVLRVGTGQWRGLEQLSLWINTTFANGGIHTSRIHESRCLRMNDCSMFPSMHWSWIYVSMDWGIQDLMLDLFQQLRISISDCCLNSFCFGVPSSDQTLLSMWNTNLLHTSFSCFQRPLLSGAFDAFATFWLWIQQQQHTGRQQERWVVTAIRYMTRVVTSVQAVTKQVYY